MAYVREKRVPGKGGKVYRYYQLVEGRRVDGKVRQHLIKHLGPFDSIQEARASLSAAAPGVVPKTERDHDVEVRKKIKRLRAAAARRRRKVDDAMVAAYRRGVELTDEEWAMVAEIEGEIERLETEAGELGFS